MKNYIKEEIQVLIKFMELFPVHRYYQSGDRGEIRHKDLIIECLHRDYKAAAENVANKSTTP